MKAKSATRENMAKVDLNPLQAPGGTTRRILWKASRDRLTLSLFLFVSCFVSQAISSAPSPSTSKASFDHQHSLWAELLGKHLVEIPGSSQLDYRAIQLDPSTLDAYLGVVSTVDRGQYDSWTSPQKLAFLINAYNAYTVKLIIRDKIPGSIKDLGGWFQSPWKKKFFKLFGKGAHLDHVEHELARKNFNNCRLHFAFNCASIGCPALLGEPWLAEKLEKQLDGASRRFLQDTSRNRYEPETNQLELSKIFKWYEGDFSKDPSCGGVARFVSNYITRDPVLQKKIATTSPRIKYLPYNWSLNIKKKMRKKKKPKK